MYRAFIASGVLLLCSTVCGRAQTGNVLPNPGFENLLNGSAEGWKNRWQRPPKPVGTMSCSPTSTLTGSAGRAGDARPAADEHVGDRRRHRAEGRPLGAEHGAILEEVRRDRLVVAGRLEDLEHLRADLRRPLLAIVPPVRESDGHRRLLGASSPYGRQHLQLQPPVRRYLGLSADELPLADHHGWL